MGQKTRSPRLTGAALDELIAEATVDCHDESEQRTGFHTMLDENLELPFRTRILGVEVVVESIDLTETEEIVAVCVRNAERQRIRVLDLPLPTPAPCGAEWIAAYRRWVRRGAG